MFSWEEEASAFYSGDGRFFLFFFAGSVFLPPGPSFFTFLSASVSSRFPFRSPKQWVE